MPFPTCPPTVTSTSRDSPLPPGTTAVICVWAMDTVGLVAGMFTPPWTSFTSVRYCVPAGPKLVPVMVMTPPADETLVTEVTVGPWYFIFFSPVDITLASVPSLAMSRENSLVPAPAGTVKRISVLTVFTVAPLFAGVTVVALLSHTIFRMLVLPAGPNRRPFTIRVPPTVPTVLEMRPSAAEVIWGPTKSRAPSRVATTLLIDRVTV